MKSNLRSVGAIPSEPGPGFMTLSASIDQTKSQKHKLTTTGLRLDSCTDDLVYFALA
jgi:hypothetical protein